MSLVIEQLGNQHKAAKKRFTCGKAELDEYLRTRAGQDQRNKLSVCHVARRTNDAEIIGYDTLATSSLGKDQLGDLTSRLKLAYETIPLVLLGRLAVSETEASKGVGSALLWHALTRAYDVSRTELGCWGVIVDPIDAGATSFYRHHGFVPLDSGKMLLPMGTIEKLVEG